MKTSGYILVFLSLILGTCRQPFAEKQNEEKPETIIEQIVENEKNEILNPEGKTIEQRFNTPKGFNRTISENGSFGDYLRSLPLKPDKSRVLLYNGVSKRNQSAHAAVINLKIGKKDLHQCADAIMRLRAEYLWLNNRYEEIHFNFTNGFRVDYSEWRKGKRIQVIGNSVKWVHSKNPSNTYEDFWNYLETIFMYAGTLSLSKELKKTEFENLEIGDVFIQGGSPGHAIIVVDKAINTETGQTLFLLAQSYMPAQEIHVLNNFENDQISPWYSEEFHQMLKTPEWNFNKTDLVRF